jgi:hypothetical protein
MAGTAFSGKGRAPTSTIRIGRPILEIFCVVGSMPATGSLQPPRPQLAERPAIALRTQSRRLSISSSLAAARSNRSISSTVSNSVASPATSMKARRAPPTPVHRTEVLVQVAAEQLVQSRICLFQGFFTIRHLRILRVELHRQHCRLVSPASGLRNEDRNWGSVSQAFAAAPRRIFDRGPDSKTKEYGRNQRARESFATTEPWERQAEPALQNSQRGFASLSRNQMSGVRSPGSKTRQSQSHCGH